MILRPVYTLHRRQWLSRGLRETFELFERPQNLRARPAAGHHRPPHSPAGPPPGPIVVGRATAAGGDATSRAANRAVVAEAF